MIRQKYYQLVFHALTHIEGMLKLIVAYCKEVINTKYYYVTYETRDGEHGYQEAGVLQANDYKLALEKAIKAKPLYDRYGWEEFCRHDEIMEITRAEYTVLKKFMLNIDYFFNEDGKLRM